MVGRVIHSVGIQNRDSAPIGLKTILKRWPWLRHIFADGGYTGPKLKGRLEKVEKFTLKIMKRSDQTNGFELLPRRWVVERTFAWLGRCRWTAKDFEKAIASAEAWIYIANIRLLTWSLEGFEVAASIMIQPLTEPHNLAQCSKIRCSNKSSQGTQLFCTALSIL